MPGLFDVSHAQVLILECAARTAHKVLPLCEATFKDSALVVPGGIDRQLVLVAP